VYLQLKNSDGVSNIKSDTILLYRPPSFSYFAINGGQANTTSTSVSLSYIVGCQPTYWRASEITPIPALTPWVAVSGAYAGSVTFVMTPAVGTKTVYMQFMNAYGTSVTKSDTILLLGPFLSPAGRPEADALAQNYPNPFNPETWIPFAVSNDTNVEIMIYTSSGQLVRRLDLGRKPAGIYTERDKSAYWDGKNEAGEFVGSGIYYYTIKAGNFVATRKMVMMK
jgi:hypothetical protein